MYASGQDVPEDRQEAFKWLTTAAWHGDEYAAGLVKQLVVS